MYKKLQNLSFFAAKGFVISLLGFAMKASANIDSGGGVSAVGTTINHSSVGSPFATGAKTAGLIDMLYPITTESKPAGSGGGGGGNAGGAGGAPTGAGGPSEKPTSKKNKGSGGGGEKKKGSKSSDTKSSKTPAAKNKEKKSGSQNSVKTKKKTK